MPILHGRTVELRCGLRRAGSERIRGSASEPAGPGSRGAKRRKIEGETIRRQYCTRSEREREKESVRVVGERERERERSRGNEEKEEETEKEEAARERQGETGRDRKRE